MVFAQLDVPQRLKEPGLLHQIWNEFLIVVAAIPGQCAIPKSLEQESACLEARHTSLKVYA